MSGRRGGHPKPARSGGSDALIAPAAAVNRPNSRLRPPRWPCRPAAGPADAGSPRRLSSSSFMPDLKALMPFAKSPMTRGSLPAPNRTRTMARTTSQCIKLIEPMWRPRKLNKLDRRYFNRSRAALRGLSQCGPALASEVVTDSPKINPAPCRTTGPRAMTYFPPPHPDWQRRHPEEAGLDPAGDRRRRALCRRARDAVEPRSRAYGRDRFRRGAAVERDAGAGAAARRPERAASLRGGHDRRRVGRHRAGRSDLQRRQELSLDPGRAGLSIAA